jgi:hypothetical protein
MISQNTGVGSLFAIARILIMMAFWILLFLIIVKILRMSYLEMEMMVLVSKKSF